MYRQHALSAISDILAPIKAFAGELGWQTSGVCTIARPGGGESFTVSTGSVPRKDGGATAPRGQHAFVQVESPAVYRMSPRCYLPRLGGNAAEGWDQAAPTSLHLMGGVERGSAYIVAVIEFGFNLYRHIYIGNMVKHGTYSGGECLSMNSGNSYTLNSNEYPINAMAGTSIARFLFSGVSSTENTNRFVDDDTDNVPDRILRGGGVKVQHADNPNTWRYFTSLRQNGAYQAKEVNGGFSDGVNDYIAAKAFCPFAGATVLVTPNLYCSFAPQNDFRNSRYVPIGHPAGVRMVNMRDLAPGAEIEVGSQTWRVFPEFSKRDAWGVPFKAGQYPTHESSFNNGYAYLVQ